MGLVVRLGKNAVRSSSRPMPSLWHPMIPDTMK